MPAVGNCRLYGSACNRGGRRQLASSSSKRTRTARLSGGMACGAEAKASVRPAPTSFAGARSLQRISGCPASSRTSKTIRGTRTRWPATLRDVARHRHLGRRRIDASGADLAKLEATQVDRQAGCRIERGGARHHLHELRARAERQRDQRQRGEPEGHSDRHARHQIPGSAPWRGLCDGDGTLGRGKTGRRAAPGGVVDEPARVAARTDDGAAAFDLGGADVVGSRAGGAVDEHGARRPLGAV